MTILNRGRNSPYHSIYNAEYTDIELLDHPYRKHNKTEPTINDKEELYAVTGGRGGKAFGS